MEPEPILKPEDSRRKGGRKLTMARIERTIEEQYERRFRRAGLHLVTPGRRTARRRPS
jgi:hypothetical protein